MIKVLGAILVIAAGGCVGLILASNYKNQVRTLRQFLFSLEHMNSELQFHLTPLPELCRHMAEITSGCLSDFYCNLASELESQVLPDAASCVNAVLSVRRDLPSYTREMLHALGVTLGRFDLNGQLKDIELLHQQCLQKLTNLVTEQDRRIRNYQAFGLCTGAALAIVLI